MSINEQQCFIRPINGFNVWIPGRQHHFDAITNFLHTPIKNQYGDNSPIYVCVAHEDGGIYEAYFHSYFTRSKLICVY